MNVPQLDVASAAPQPVSTEQSAIEAQDLSIYYGSFQAVRDVNLSFPRRRITAIIGPSGCGKSTVLRSLNRMNDLIPSARTEGRVLFHGKNIYDPDVDAVEVRRRIGMVFQKPNPFPKSIYENVAWGARINGYQGDMDELVERVAALRGPVGRGQGQARSRTPCAFPAASSRGFASHGPSPWSRTSS